MVLRYTDTSATVVAGNTWQTAIDLSASPASALSSTARTSSSTASRFRSIGDSSTAICPWVFPSWAHPFLGFYAVAINKGGVDYDINARMVPDNRA
jgi:hypothetical protein